MKKLFILFFVLSMLSTTIYASDLDLGELQNTITGDFNENLVSGNAKDILGDISISTDIDIASQSIGILERSADYINSAFKNTTATMLKIFVMLVISSVGQGFCTSNDIKQVNGYINMATAISISSVILLEVKSVLNICSSAIYEIDTLSNSLLPTLVTAITFSGAPTTAALSHTASVFVFNVIISLISDVLFPFCYVYIAIITVNAATSNDLLVRLASFIKWATTGSLKLILTGFITYMSITSVISGTADNLAIKTTKFASGFIPVVGSIISDASETILVGASIIKNAVGIFGIFAVISICIVPLTQILLNFFMFKLTAAVMSPICSKEISGLLDGISGGFGMAFAMLCSSGAIIFIMMVVSILAVGQF